MRISIVSPFAKLLFPYSAACALRRKSARTYSCADAGLGSLPYNNKWL